MKRFSLFSVSSMVCLLSACGGISKSMDDMNSSTNKMSATMDSLDESTKKTVSNTDLLSKSTGASVETTQKLLVASKFTYTDLRTSNTRQARQDSLSAMEKSKEASTKLGYASEYFGSMDFQFWKADVDSVDDREDMKAVAVRDFFRKVQEYIRGEHELVDPLDPTLDPTNPTNAKDPRYADRVERFKNLSALASTLHFINLAQPTALKANPDLKLESMLSLIQEGLMAKAALSFAQTGDSGIPVYQAEVLRNEQDAIYILKVRQNALKAMALALSASTTNGDDFTHNAEVMKSMNDPTHPQWIPNYNSRNTAELNYIAAILKYALDTQLFLSHMGVDPENSRELSGVISLINKDAIKATEPAKVKALARISGLMEALLQGGVPNNGSPAPTYVPAVK